NAEFFFLDERQYRDASAKVACASNPDPYGVMLGPLTRDEACLRELSAERTMLGAEQLQWLLDGLRSSNARLKFVVNNVPLTFLGVYPYDRWDGYDAERRTILEYIDANAIDGVVFLTTDIHANALLEGKTTQQKIDPVGFVQALIRVVPTIAKHNRFSECGENKERATAHMMVLYGFIGLFIVTNCFFVAEWVFHIEGPYSQINPIKWLGNIGGIALLIGGGLMIAKRLGQKEQTTSYKDWYLLGLVLLLGGTGLLTEMLRLGHMYDLSAFVYFLHLIFIWSLFAYTPFSKLAHIVYRTVAMTYQEYSGRK
ncbi:MAG: alkaline phosphatase D family protein, partial [Desulfatitalea sp.]|nr:alkaline phosphatase D family protein [Desulfatitalea sp.]